MTDFPCIKLKCLKYPACKSKNIITCDELYRYYKDEKHRSIMYAAQMMQIRKYLYKVIAIKKHETTKLTEYVFIY